jgi:hypothetical protein
VLGAVYTSKARLSMDGLAVGGWEDERVASLIRRCSAAVDTYTRQHFGPLPQTVQIDGTGASFIYRRDLFPIVELSRVEVVAGRTHRSHCGYRKQPVLGPVQDYLLRPEGDVRRWVELLPLLGAERVFPVGVGNVELEGVFGWLDAGSIKSVATVLAADLQPGDADVFVQDVGPLAPRDIVLIGGHAGAFVDSVDTGANSFAITPLAGVLAGTVPAGTPVRSWGAPPGEIEEVTAYLCMLSYRQQVGLEEGRLIDPILIRSEKTDHYQYETWAPYQMVGLQGVSGVLGNPRMDAILERFTAPPFPVFMD